MTDRRGLRSQAQEAERKERELMDLKMEVTHLRERLQQRVGGSATAAELEADAYALQSALNEAQQTIRTREAELHERTIKYDKAIRGLLRLDEALKQSKQQTREAQETQLQLERRLKDAEQRSDELQQQLQAASGRETTLALRVDTLMQEKQQVQQQRDEKAQEAQQRELQVHELRAQLEVTRQNFEMQMKTQEGATREDVRRLQEQLQKAEENAAALRGEIHARQEEAAKVEAELRDVREAEAAAKQRLVKLTEDHAMLRVHLESAKEVAVESSARAIQAETENDSMRRELDERDQVLSEKEQAMRALEAEVIEKQNTIDEEITRRKQAVQETEQRLTTECQEMLQAQEETWSCRENALQGEAAGFKEELARIRTFHVELMHLMQPPENGVKVEQPESVESATLRVLVEQEISKRDALTTCLEQLKVKLAATKRQLGSQKQLEADNSRLRAEYEKAKLAMERMATRKAKSFASVASLPGRPSGHDSSSACSSDKSVGKENNPSARASPLVKRKLERGDASIEEVRTTPRKARRSKDVVYVASRYLSSASKR